MDAKSLEELQRPDDRAGYFTPGLRDAEAVAEYHQRVIGRLELADVVPEQVRAAFDQLRELYGYGVLWYDLYTVAHDRARLILEYALRERFLGYPRRHSHVPRPHRGRACPAAEGLRRALRRDPQRASAEVAEELEAASRRDRPAGPLRRHARLAAALGAMRRLAARPAQPQPRDAAEGASQPRGARHGLPPARPRLRLDGDRRPRRGHQPAMGGDDSRRTPLPAADPPRGGRDRMERQRHDHLGPGRELPR